MEERQLHRPCVSACLFHQRFLQADLSKPDHCSMSVEFRLGVDETIDCDDLLHLIKRAHGISNYRETVESDQACCFLSYLNRRVSRDFALIRIFYWWDAASEEKEVATAGVVELGASWCCNFWKCVAELGNACFDAHLI